MDVVTALQALIDSLGGEWFTHAITTAPAQFGTFVVIVSLVFFAIGYSIKDKQLQDKESELEKTKTDLNSKQAEIDLLNQKHKTELSDISFRHQKEISALQNVSQKLETDLVSANAKADRAIEEAKEKFNTEIAIEKIRIENENKLKEESRLREEQRNKEKLEHEAKQLEQKRIENFKRLDYDVKTLIAEAYFLGEFVAKESFIEYRFEYVDPLDYLNYETKLDGEHYTLNDETKELIDNHPELISQFDKEMFQ